MPADARSHNAGCPLLEPVVFPAALLLPGVRRAEDEKVDAGLRAALAK